MSVVHFMNNFVSELQTAFPDDDVVQNTPDTTASGNTIIGLDGVSFAGDVSDGNLGVQVQWSIIALTQLNTAEKLNTGFAAPLDLLCRMALTIHRAGMVYFNENPAANNADRNAWGKILDMSDPVPYYTMRNEVWTQTGWQMTGRHQIYYAIPDIEPGADAFRPPLEHLIVSDPVLGDRDLVG